MRTLFATALLALTFAAAGCGSTQILTTDPTARIFVDGRAVGRGRADIDKRGTPGSAKVVVKTADGREEQSTIRRSFTGLTLLAGVFTYGICLVACWEYPDTVFIPLPPTTAPPAPPPSPTARVATADPWLTPPPDWHPRHERGTPAPAAPHDAPPAW